MPDPAPLHPTLHTATVFRLERGDVLVFRHPLALTPATTRTITDQLERHFPGHKCIVLEEGADLEAVRVVKLSERFEFTTGNGPAQRVPRERASVPDLSTDRPAPLPEPKAPPLHHWESDRPIGEGD